MLSMFSQVKEPLDLAEKLRQSAALGTSVQVFTISQVQKAKLTAAAVDVQKQLADNV